VSEVVVTLGSRGCIVYADGVAELVRAHAVPASDPTGAGDVFATGYLAARSGGAAPTAAARRAAALVTDILSGRAA
jgi:sugar/nucleoside kinase (ribokinase family)